MLLQGGEVTFPSSLRGARLLRANALAMTPLTSLRGARFLACHCEADEVSRSNLKAGSTI